jgi:hypothetical protein
MMETRWPKCNLSLVISSCMTLDCMQSCSPSLSTPSLSHPGLCKVPNVILPPPQPSFLFSTSAHWTLAICFILGMKQWENTNFSYCCIVQWSSCFLVPHLLGKHPSFISHFNPYLLREAFHATTLEQGPYDWSPLVISHSLDELMHVSLPNQILIS